jgi:LysM repeat protein
VARGISSTRDGAPRGLAARDTRNLMRIAGIALAAIVLLAACEESREVPTLAPAPTLAVVTATLGPPPVPTPGEQQRYVVREGDTLSGIAARFGVSENAILEANPLSDPDRLLVGQELVIPPAQP